MCILSRKIPSAVILYKQLAPFGTRQATWPDMLRYAYRLAQHLKLGQGKINSLVHVSYIFVNLHHKIVGVGHILVIFIQFIHFTFRGVGDKIKIQKSDFEKSTIGRVHRTSNRFGVALQAISV